MYVRASCFRSHRGFIVIILVHNWYDVLAGGTIGICTAIVAFRQTFASVLDFRFNHLLLPRSTSLFHRQPFLPLAGRGPYFTYQPMPEYVSYDLPFTREGGWGYGYGEQMVSAPVDATVLNTRVRTFANTLRMLIKGKTPPELPTQTMLINVAAPILRCGWDANTKL